MTTSRVLYNGTIYVSFRPEKKVDALVTFNERVAYGGEESAALGIADRLGSEKVDLHGITVMPGFIDAHMHLDGFGITLESLDLRGTRSIVELQAKVKAYAVCKPNQKWVRGGGWDQELFREARLPTRWDLDEVVDDRPVVLTRVCGHMAALNSRALKEFEEFPQKGCPQTMHINEGGELTGIVTEEAISYIEGLIATSVTAEDRLRQLYGGMEHAVSQGITTLGFVSCDPESFHALQILRREGRLLTRIRVYLTPNALGSLQMLGIHGGYGDDKLRVTGIKVLADGSLGARTALLSFPYNDDLGNRGRATIREDDLMKVGLSAQELDLQLATHGIGDSAIDMILRAYGRMKSTRRLRHRIDHCSIVRADQIDLMKKIGNSVTIQPHFVLTDWWAVNRIGREHSNFIYPFATLVRNIAGVGLSTDSPVEPLNPWETVYAAVTRGADEKVPLATYSPGERLSLEEALHCYTYGSAYVLNEEGELGTLELGKLADYIILDGNPFSEDIRDVRTFKAFEVYVGDKRSYPT